MKEFLIDEELSSLRLDEALTRLLEGKSRSYCAKLVKEGHVQVNGILRKSHFILESGDRVNVEEVEAKPTYLKPQDIPVTIIYEDEDILIVDKPKGLVVHPGNGNPDGTLANALVALGKVYDDGTSLRPGIVHRIDKDTSGLLAIAKSELAFKSLSEQLLDHSMSRKYEALVLGVIGEEEGKIDAPIGRDKDNPMRYKVDLKGKESVTYFSVKERFTRASATYIHCRLLTGRTHQIRVHLDYIGHPLLGDLLYGKGNRKMFDDGQLLHAYELTLTHPRTKEKMTFTSPMPDYFMTAIAKLRE